MLAFTDLLKATLHVFRPGQSQPPRVLASGARGAPTWTRDGKAVLFIRGQGTATEIATVTIEEGAQPTSLGNVAGLSGRMSLSAQ